MANIRADVVMPYITGTPEDVVVNTYHFDMTIVGAPAFEAIRDALVDVYNAIEIGSGEAMCEYLSAYIDRGTDACRVIFYEDGVEGPSLGEYPWTLQPAATDDSLPFEVALCGSFSGYTPGGIKARQRGRIYYGPWALAAINTPDDAPATPTPAVRGIVALGQKRLCDDAGLATNLTTWVVWSRVDGASVPVTAGWCDNAWDTQRRRQVEASFRETWVAA